MIRRIFKIIAFIIFYVKELIKANARVAFDILSPKLKFIPGVIAIPLQAKTDIEILALANLITMTPGTLSLDVSTDRRVIYIHVLHIDDIEKTRRSIMEGLEKKILEVSG